MTMTSGRKWSIAIQPSAGEAPHKITKIIGLNGDGFSVLAPYHQARSGFLFKHLMDLQSLGERAIPWEECVAFTAEDRVKLTYHIDGFAQFSGENPGNIISGRDPRTREPKGLGLLTRPLSTPIVSGPSVGVTLWGIEDFEAVEEEEELIKFEPSDFYYRNSRPADANLCWRLAIYAFPVDHVPPLRFEGLQSVMDFTLHPISGGVPGAIVKLKMVYLKEERVYLGLYVERFAHGFPSKSGWMLNGPGNYTQYQSGYVLQAVYPRVGIPIEGRPSLDRSPADSHASDDGQHDSK